MENLEERSLTDNVDKLALLNKYNQNYSHYPYTAVDMKAVSKDFELLLEYSKAYQKRHVGTQPNLGDSLQLPDGQIVYFCHIWDDSVQTCMSGSFHLTTIGNISYSGGLDSGISHSDIELTDEKSILRIWFSHRGYLCGGCGIYANIECRVWKTKEGADLSGIPQIKKLKRKKLKEQCETITKVDGNQRSYTEPLPEIVIKKSNLSEEFFKIVQQVTGLQFEDDNYYVPVYWSQPMTMAQIDKLKQFTEFSIREDRDISTYLPVLVFEIKHKSKS